MSSMYEIALAERGQAELRGPRSNPRIAEYIAAVGGRLEDSKFAWCGAFMAWCALQCGLPFKKTGLARAWLKWGDAVPLEDARPGDVVVLWRGTREGVKGHVAFFVRWLDGEKVELYGGNTKNAVRDGVFPRYRILSVRRFV